jgi:integrase
MRVGEALALDDADVDLHNRSLTIRHAKGDSRQLQLHPSTVQALGAYARLRQRLCPAPSQPSFFVSTLGTRVIYECVFETFIKLRTTTGLDARRPRPRIHDLRHSFAVGALVEWHRASVEDVAARLPLLQAWLGHRHPASTYYYLQAAPELLALAAQRLPDLGARP